MDKRRLADVRAGTSAQTERSGSGYLLGKHLVLTARHVLVDDGGVPWPRVEVYLGHPGDGSRLRARALLVWQSAEHDVGLLQVEAEAFVDAEPVRWGQITGSDPLKYAGMGFPAFADYASGRGVEQLHGIVSPLAAGVDGGLVLDQATAPEATTRRVWPGISGAAVFSEGLLIAVVRVDDELFGNRRLHAVPAHVLLADPDLFRLVARDTGMLPVLEGVELKEFLGPPAEQIVAHTPGSLLAATVGAVGFTGRQGVLQDMADWRDSAARFSVLLVTGEGGQGKTRLALEFARRCRRAGWIAGFVRVSSAVGYDHSADIRQLSQRISASVRPVLLIVDYAETHTSSISVLADELTSNRSIKPVRLLLLSRTAQSWWDNFAETIDQENTQLIELGQLTDTPEERKHAYHSALTDLARQLPLLPESATGENPVESWTVLVQQLAEQPRDLDDVRFGNALTLHMTALKDLLTRAVGRQSAWRGKSPERELVRHERNYLRRAAARRGLFGAGVLSDRTDADDRTSYAWTALERALAGLILLGPRNFEMAQQIGALASAVRRCDVTRWLVACYPPRSGCDVGTVQPDRLAEFLLGPLLVRETSLLGEIASLINNTDDALGALSTLLRTAAHPEFTSISAQIRNLIVANPVPFAQAAPILAVTNPQETTLRDGLLALGLRNPQAFRENTVAVLQDMPEQSVSRAAFNAGLAEVLTSILSNLATVNPDTQKPYLAELLNIRGHWQSGSGQRDAGLASFHESVALRRELAQTNPDTHLSSLAMSLSNLANALMECGQQDAALVAAQESADIFRKLAKATPDVYRPLLAATVGTLGTALGHTGQRNAALAAARESVVIRRELVEANPDAHLPDLALSLSNLAIALTESELHAEPGLLQEALTIAQESTEIYRRMAEANPDAYLPELARLLNVLGSIGAQSGLREEALAAAQEAVGIYRGLVEVSPDAFLPSLGATLTNLANMLKECGDREGALAAAQEAVGIYRGLVEVSPDAFLPSLGATLTNLADAVMKCGDRKGALVAAQEAVGIYRGLVEVSPDAYRPKLAISLNTLAFVHARSGQLGAAVALMCEAAAQAPFPRPPGEHSDTHLVELMGSLDFLVNWLAEDSWEGEDLLAWESAIASLTEDSLRLSFTVAYAHLQLLQSSASEGRRLLVAIMTTPDIPSPIEAKARQILREQWHQDSASVEEVWREVNMTPVPDWMYLSDQQIHAVANWMKTEDSTESFNYFKTHEQQLLPAVSDTVLDELALLIPAEILEPYRLLLAAVRERGIVAAYRTKALKEAVFEWVTAQGWDASEAFLRAHPEILTQEAADIFAGVDFNEGGSPIMAIHEVLLNLARGPGGIDSAYRCITNRYELTALTTEAIKTRDPDLLYDCALLEAAIHNKGFRAAFHISLSWILKHPGAELPEEFVAPLKGVARRGTTGDRKLVQQQLHILRGDMTMSVSQQLQKALAHDNIQRRPTKSGRSRRR